MFLRLSVTVLSTLLFSLTGGGPASAQPTQIAQVSSGFRHTCALDVGGQVWCWGDNAFGQLGNGTRERSLRPVPVPGLNRVIQISLGLDHSCALRDNGQVLCWGLNSDGQLGDGSFINRTQPVLVSGLRLVSSIGAGGFHTCAVRNTGSVHCWGHNRFGQLGDGTNRSRSTPIQAARLSQASGVALSAWSSCALLANRRVSCWGDNSYGQLGDGSRTRRSTPVTMVSGLSTAVQISGGDAHYCAVLASGAVSCWGNNGNGQLGNRTRANSLVPVTAVGLTDARSIELGGLHSCAVRRSNLVACWGWNGAGQLGSFVGSGENELVPQTRQNLSGVAQVAAGGEHTCSITTARAALCWGRNSFGQLGDGSTNSTRDFTSPDFNRFFPVQGFSNWADAERQRPISRITARFGAYTSSTQASCGYVASTASPDSHLFHAGSDIGCLRNGTACSPSANPLIYAPISGQIVYHRRPAGANTDWLQTFVILRGDDGLDYLLAHLNCTRCRTGVFANSDAARYPQDQLVRVRRGDPLGTMRLAGTGMHLHLGVSTQSMVNPDGSLASAFRAGRWAGVRYPRPGTRHRPEENQVPSLAAARELARSIGYVDPAPLFGGQSVPCN